MSRLLIKFIRLQKRKLFLHTNLTIVYFAGLLVHPEQQLLTATTGTWNTLAGRADGSWISVRSREGKGSS